MRVLPTLPRERGPPCIDAFISNDDHDDDDDHITLKQMYRHDRHYRHNQDQRNRYKEKTYE